jgi:hypothetical protein
MDSRNPISLIEPGVKSFLKISLQNCKQLKEQYYSAIFNASAFAIFAAIVSIILFIKYKFKPTPEERENKLQEQREYVLSKLKLVNAKNFLASKTSAAYSGAGAGSAMGETNAIANVNMGSITNLPNWTTTAVGHYELFSQNQKRRPDEDYFMRLQT